MSIHPAGKDYPIQASTKDEMLVWVKAIEDAKVRVHLLYILHTYECLLAMYCYCSCHLSMPQFCPSPPIPPYIYVVRMSMYSNYFNLWPTYM